MSNKSFSYRNDRRVKEVIRERLTASLTGDKIDKKTVFSKIKRLSSLSISLSKFEQI